MSEIVTSSINNGDVYLVDRYITDQTYRPRDQKIFYSNKCLLISIAEGLIALRERFKLLGTQIDRRVNINDKARELMRMYEFIDNEQIDVENHIHLEKINRMACNNHVIINIYIGDENIRDVDTENIMRYNNKIDKHICQFGFGGSDESQTINILLFNQGHYEYIISEPRVRQNEEPVKFVCGIDFNDIKRNADTIRTTFLFPQDIMLPPTTHSERIQELENKIKQLEKDLNQCMTEKFLLNEQLTSPVQRGGMTNVKKYLLYRARHH